MLQAVVQSLHGRKTVARFDVIEVDDLNFESFGDRVVHHIRTSSRNRHKYLLLHHPSVDCVLPRTASLRADSLNVGAGKSARPTQTNTQTSPARNVRPTQSLPSASRPYSRRPPAPTPSPS